MAGDGRVFPLDERRFAGLHIDGFHLRVRDVALVLQLPQVEAARRGDVLDVHISLIIRGVLAHRGIRAVVEQEGNPVDSLLGDGINLVNQNAGEGFVSHRQSGTLVVLDGEIVGCGIQLETLPGLDLDGIEVTSVQIDMYPARGIRGDRLNQGPIHLPNLKGGVGNALGFIGCTDLNQLQTANALVIKGELLTLAALFDEDALRRGIQHKFIAGGLDFFGSDGSSGSHA